MHWRFRSAVLLAVILCSAGALNAGIWDVFSTDRHQCDCENCIYCDKESRLCACRPFCPRGTCGYVDTGCLRTDYARYVPQGTNVSAAKQIRAEYYPRYRARCRDFWLRDLAPCAQCP